VGDPQRRARLRRIEIGIEHAAPRAELQLQTIALADLEGRVAEARDQLLRAESDQLARLIGLRSRRLRDCDHGLLLRPGGAGGEEQGQGGG
jgi:hypothetical protein